jgi:hypothetical protein
VKKVIDDLQKEQAIWTGQYVDNHVNNSLKWSKETYKDFQMYTLSKEELAKWYALLKPMDDKYLKEYEAKGIPTKAILDDVLKSKDKYSKEYAK